MTVASEVKETVPAGIYANPEARKILEFLLEFPQTILTSTLLPTDELRFEQVEKILGETSTDAVRLLEEMTSAQVLVSQFVDKVPACPNCASTQVSTRYICPQCASHDVNRTHLFEHLKCGKVGNEESFKKGEQIICPKCQTVLHDFGVEYRAIGVWYECNQCKNSFNNPNHSHFCRPKRHEFPTERVTLVPIYQYELNRNSMDSIRREVIVYADAITYLENLGLTVKAPHSIVGKSGQPHSFNIVLTLPKKGWRGEERTVAIDVIVKGYATEPDVFKDYVAKARDVKPSQAYLIATPALPEDSKALLKDAKLPFFEGPSLRKAMQTFREASILKEHLAE
jgi:transposase-like protein